MFNFVFVTFPCGILDQVWYFIVPIPDLCHLSSFPLTVQYELVDNSYNDSAAFCNHLLRCVDLIQNFFPESKSKSISDCFKRQAGMFGVNVFSIF